MKAIRRFTVRVTLPEPLAALHGLMLNLRWSWHGPTADLFASIDPAAWEASGGDPIAMLKEFPGRTRTIHIKEHKEKTFDSAFYKEIFQLCETSSGTKWYIIEIGGPNGEGFDVPPEALEKLHRLGK